MSKTLSEIAKMMSAFISLPRAMSREYRIFAKLAAEIDEDTIALQAMTDISKEDLQHHVMHGWTVKKLKMMYLMHGKLPEKCSGCDLCEWMERNGPK